MTIKVMMDANASLAFLGGMEGEIVMELREKVAAQLAGVIQRKVKEVNVQLQIANAIRNLTDSHLTATAWGGRLRGEITRALDEHIAQKARDAVRNASQEAATVMLEQAVEKILPRALAEVEVKLWANLSDKIDKHIKDRVDTLLGGGR